MSSTFVDRSNEIPETQVGQASFFNRVVKKAQATVATSGGSGSTSTTVMGGTCSGCGGH